MAADLEGQLREIRNKDNTSPEQYNPATMSLQALAAAIAAIGPIAADLAVPAANSAANLLERDAIGNKGDAAVYSASATASLLAYAKAVLGVDVLAVGTLTTSSATVPADNTRAEASGYWSGYQLMTLSGAVSSQPRTIQTFTGVTGVFTIDPNNAFTTATGTVAYVILPPGTSPLLTRQLSSFDGWSVQQENVTIPAVAADQALPSVVIAVIPSGATIIRVQALFKWRVTENTNGAGNNLSGAQSIQIQKGAGGFTNAVSFVTGQLAEAATTREGGDAAIGSIDLSATVTGNDTYNFKWASALAAQASLVLHDVQTGLRIWYR